MSIQRLREAAEKAKIELSSSIQVSLKWSTCNIFEVFWRGFSESLCIADFISWIPDSAFWIPGSTPYISDSTLICLTDFTTWFLDSTSFCLDSGSQILDPTLIQFTWFWIPLSEFQIPIFGLWIPIPGF